jgi:multicomponent Na+:H+ antiporter subunit G
MSSLALVGAVITLTGTLICMVGGIGLIRLPDFFARTHAGGVTDTMGAGLTILGMVLLAVAFDGPLEYRVMVIIKLVSIVVLMLVTSPIAGHAVARAALESGVGMDKIPLSMLRKTRFSKDIPQVSLTGTVEEKRVQLETCLESLEKFALLTSREQLQINYLGLPFENDAAVKFNEEYDRVIQSRADYATRDFLPAGLDAKAVLLMLVAKERHQELEGEVSA